MKGIIALDIDGTSTSDFHTLTNSVALFYEELVREGWKLIFITGRTFSWSYRALKTLDCSYSLAVQNGAIILQMPSKELLFRRYLEKNIFPFMEQACAHEPTDYVIYAGYEYEDVCYYRPNHFSTELLDYLNYRAHELQENWIEVEKLSELSIPSFPSVKCFGSLESLQRIQAKIDEDLQLHMPIVRDPLNKNSYVAQATHPHVTKGWALKDFCASQGNSPVVIAAGDDYNDLSMLQEASIRVVMSTAPKQLLEMAHVVAPAAQFDGIIEGLKEAIKLVK